MPFLQQEIIDNTFVAVLCSTLYYATLYINKATLFLTDVPSVESRKTI